MRAPRARDKMGATISLTWGRPMNKSNPASRAFAINPSDSTELQGVRSLYVGGSGNLAVLMREDSVAVTFVSVGAGTFLPIEVSKVLATGTTASSILGLR